MTSKEPLPNFFKERAPIFISAAINFVSFATFNFTPGPIVDVSVTLLK